LLVVVIGAFAVVVGTYQAAEGRRLEAEASRIAAEHREDRLTELVGLASQRAHAIDARLLRMEGLLEGLVVASARALASPAPDVATYLSRDFANAESPPPGLRKLDHYNAPISFDHPVQKLAPGIALAPMDEQRRQMAGLQSSFYRLLVRSYTSDLMTRSPKEQRSVLVGRPSPIVWAFVSTEQGLHTKLPGKGGYGPQYDGRKRDWYKAGKAHASPQWGATYTDSDGSQLLLPCSLSVRDDEGKLLGVAGIDLSVDRIVDELLDPQLGAGIHSYVVDGDGNIVVASVYKGGSVLRGDARFLFQEQLNQRRAKSPTGHFEAGETLIVWGDLGVKDWTYVITGPTTELM